MQAPVAQGPLNRKSSIGIPASTRGRTSQLWRGKESTERAVRPREPKEQVQDRISNSKEKNVLMVGQTMAKT